MNTYRLKYQKIAVKVIQHARQVTLSFSSAYKIKLSLLSTGIKCCRFNVLNLYFKKSAMSDILLYTHFKPFENKMKKISRFGSINKANLFLLSFHE